MKIAMMVRSYIPAPRPKDMIYAPIDLAVAIAKGLGSRGHKVTFFAPLGTEVYGENVTVETTNLRPLVENQLQFADLLQNTDALIHEVPGLWDRYMATEMFCRADKKEFDLLHFHHPEVALSGAVQHPKIPTVYTLHDPISAINKELFELFSSANQKFIAISNNQKRDAADLPYLGRVYNATDITRFEYSDEPEDYLLFVGRITPEKGVKEAIQVAKESGNRLLIIGPVAHDKQGYFDQYIKPELDDKILYLGSMEQDQLPKYYQKAKALLTPVQWEEPFGLTTIESMACGTPVISLNRGAAPEIINDGKTGYIVNGIADMVKAVGKVDKIKRRDCRAHVARKFSIEHMVSNYEKAFLKMLDDKNTTPVKYDHTLKTAMKKVRQVLPKITARKVK